MKSAIVGGERFAVAHLRAFRDQAGDIGTARSITRKATLTAHDFSSLSVRTADYFSRARPATADEVSLASLLICAIRGVAYMGPFQKQKELRSARQVKNWAIWDPLREDGAQTASIMVPFSRFRVGSSTVPVRQMERRTF